eukprot:GHVS01045205.1.p1 GENE.GHVS01045205.1~~GHVS01045205.1.p1  ORF type:complete len:722 (-),score=58.58 GHVS01045205.1:256-2421(-)
MGPSYRNHWSHLLSLPMEAVDDIFPKRPEDRLDDLAQVTVNSCEEEVHSPRKQPVDQMESPNIDEFMSLENSLEDISKQNTGSADPTDSVRCLWGLSSCNGNPEQACREHYGVLMENLPPVRPRSELQRVAGLDSGLPFSSPTIVNEEVIGEISPCPVEDLEPRDMSDEGNITVGGGVGSRRAGCFESEGPVRDLGVSPKFALNFEIPCESVDVKERTDKISCMPDMDGRPTISNADVAEGSVDGPHLQQPPPLSTRGTSKARPIESDGDADFQSIATSCTEVLDAEGMDIANLEDLNDSRLEQEDVSSKIARTQTLSIGRVDGTSSKVGDENSYVIGKPGVQAELPALQQGVLPRQDQPVETNVVSSKTFSFSEFDTGALLSSTRDSAVTETISIIEEELKQRGLLQRWHALTQGYLRFDMPVVAGQLSRMPAKREPLTSGGQTDSVQGKGVEDGPETLSNTIVAWEQIVPVGFGDMFEAGEIGKFKGCAEVFSLERTCSGTRGLLTYIHSQDEGGISRLKEAFLLDARNAAQTCELPSVTGKEREGSVYDEQAVLDQDDKFCGFVKRQQATLFVARYCDALIHECRQKSSPLVAPASSPDDGRGERDLLQKTKRTEEAHSRCKPQGTKKRPSMVGLFEQINWAALDENRLNLWLKHFGVKQSGFRNSAGKARKLQHIAEYLLNRPPTELPPDPTSRNDKGDNLEQQDTNSLGGIVGLLS